MYSRTEVDEALGFRFCGDADAEDICGIVAGVVVRERQVSTKPRTS